MKKKKPDVMECVKILFDKSGLSLDELGQRMGYGREVARKSAWQFLNKTSDPRFSMIQKFAAALSLSIVDVIK